MGTVPVDAQASAACMIKVTGKGFYAGETRNIPFTLDVGDDIPRKTACYMNRLMDMRIEQDVYGAYHDILMIIGVAVVLAQFIG